MKMAKFILSRAGILFFISTLYAQNTPVLLLDTFLPADKIYLDPLDQIYLINDHEKRITKCDIQLRVLKKISFNRGWDQALLDVSDPFKCILYYPGDHKILILDESLSSIGTYDEPELNMESSVCHYSTNFLGIYSNNSIKIKNYEEQKIISSDPLLNYDINLTDYHSQLKYSNAHFYLLRSGIGVTRYNHQLFEDQVWLDDRIEKIDVYSDLLFYQIGSQIFKSGGLSKTEELVLKTTGKIKFFTVNREYLIWLEEDRLKMVHWTKR